MQTAALVEGRSYAFREKPRAGTPLLKVKVLEKVGRRGHIKIRFEDGPHPGLEEYVNVRQIIVPWGERKALLRDEERIARIEQAVKRDPAREGSHQHGASREWRAKCWRFRLASHAGR